MNKKEDSIRTFWHELGHFFAAIYNNNKEVKSIEIRYSASAAVYGGKIFFVIPPETDIDSNEILFLPEQIASLVYGCFFQGLYLDRFYEECFSDNNVKNSGYHDFSDFRKALNDIWEFLKMDPLSSWFSKFYLDTLKNDQNLRNLIKGDKYKSFLEEYEDTYIINPSKLKIIFHEDIESHRHHYNTFLIEIKRILNWDDDILTIRSLI